ncbi:MarR family winged helix-turn-helix transcriptional regulator [Ketogulonicigenium vulgare]|uniref:Transcriptional regulator, MarR family protein n=1 Tax=Ketogulonicigenium vulgare (strain WSH-001) TaxID=759362 RepID=F9Y663_KETVW|nr:MarR family transcriptional regulator [Ketogulonicigenium vulgare]ADO43797.1 MarR family transcriptional regulator [Ketogulonicigenium vulgare Y25]AEM42060.1 Transcriptional regulator, MarR family protein [Ketogulonicigenium vulgare WSH-001]ALJ82154.1 MarR family transcriptional regulator [Ketogulonicigenium vulgare]ANW34776.1 MarR family transcriptional regulator [Ketogulonicigenium vulgare]AOZ55831.1 MarR family transcriptional regulator [Ketogulonicigenium vulgare]
MSGEGDDLAIVLFSEILMLEQLVSTALSRALPRGMELSHFSVLNHLANTGGEKTPAQLARIFHLTKGAMTNTLRKLEWAGWVHIRPDWDDARRKLVAISPAGRAARDAAVAAIGPLVTEAASAVGPAKVRAALPVLRDLRQKMAQLEAAD